MRLLTYNCSAIPLLTSGVRVRLALLAKEIVRLDPDIVCLQELGLLPHARFLAARLEGWRYRFWRARPSGLTAGALALFAKVPPARAAFEAFQEQGPWLGYSYISRLTRKGFMVLEWDQPRLRLVHTHPLADFGLWRPTRTDYYGLQGAQFDQLIARVRSPTRPADGGPPLVLAGDFNMSPGSSHYLRLRDELGLSDAMEGESGPSMVPEADFPAPVGLPRRLERLDYIFLRRAAGRARYVLGRVYELGGRRTCLSDHLGVLGELELHGP